MRNKIYRIIFIVLLVVLNISCDQISKNVVRNEIAYSQKIAVIENYFTLTKVENTGAFLSLGSTIPRPLYYALMIIMPLAVIAYGFYYLIATKKLSPYLITGLSFIIGGGLGNIYDRALYGSVTDFMHMDFVLFETGIFNMADLSVMVGMFILLIEYLIKRTGAIATT